MAYSPLEKWDKMANKASKLVEVNPKEKRWGTIKIDFKD